MCFNYYVFVRGWCTLNTCRVFTLTRKQILPNCIHSQAVTWFTEQVAFMPHVFCSVKSFCLSSSWTENWIFHIPAGLLILQDLLVSHFIVLCFIQTYFILLVFFFFDTMHNYTLRLWMLFILVWIFWGWWLEFLSVSYFIVCWNYILYFMPLCGFKQQRETSSNCIRISPAIIFLSV